MTGKRRDRSFTDAIADRDPKRRGVLFEGISGRAGAVVSGVSGAAPNIRGMLVAAFGFTRRGDVNTRAAAKELGVSQRTVQRWLADPSRQQRIGRPKPATLATLTSKSRQAATTKAGRRRIIAEVRQSKNGQRLLKHGGRVRISGKQGVAASGGFYVRQREVLFPPEQDGMSPADIDAMWSSYEQGGEKGLSDWMTGYADEHYVPGWTFETIDEFEVKPL